MDVAPGPRCAKHMCVPFIASKALSVVLMTTVADARVGFFFKFSVCAHVPLVVTGFWFFKEENALLQSCACLECSDCAYCTQ